MVAFGTEHPETGTEGLVIVAETRVTDAGERTRLESEVTERVAAAIDVPPDRVVLAPPGAVLKTSSGKVRRAATRERYLAGEVGRAPRTTATQKLRLAAAAAAEALRPGVRGAARGLYALYLALVLPLVILPVWLAALLVPSRGLAFTLGRLGTRLGLRLMGCRLSTTGLENVPREGAVVLACNHASYTDVFALVALLPRNLLFVAKKEVLGYPVIRTFVRRLGYPTVDRLDFQQEPGRRRAGDPGPGGRRGGGLLPRGHLRGRHRSPSLPPGGLQDRGRRRGPGGAHGAAGNAPAPAGRREAAPPRARSTSTWPRR